MVNALKNWQEVAEMLSSAPAHALVSSIRWHVCSRVFACVRLSKKGRYSVSVTNEQHTHYN